MHASLGLQLMHRAGAFFPPLFDFYHSSLTQFSSPLLLPFERAQPATNEKLQSDVETMEK
jgi:hypothetical protein